MVEHLCEFASFLPVSGSIGEGGKGVERKMAD